jgi:adenylate cyclase
MSDDGDKALDEPRSTAPSDAEVRAQVERILTSESFSQAARSSRFLRYVVDETLAGRGERLKGYTLAVEVFDRPADFDAQTDPLVRVEAGRVRRRLVEYYARAGRADPVVVELPRGGYAVVCSYAPASTSVEAPATTREAASSELRAVSAAPAARRWWRGRTLAVAAAALVFAALFAARELLAPREDVGSAVALASGGSATITVIPFDVLDGDAATRALGATLTEELLLELDEHELFATAIGPAAGDASTAAAPPAARPYRLSGSVRATADSVRITARLVAADTGEQLWTASHDEPAALATLPAEQTRIVRSIAGVAAPYGPVFKSESVRVATLAPAQLRTSDCVIKYYEYRSRPGPALHDGVLRCFERVAATMPQLANSWAGLALLLLDIYSFGYGTAAESGQAALERAGEAARRAMDIDGESLLANLALARVQFFADGVFERSAERALVLCPNNIEALHLVGTLFVLAGDATRGLALVERAIALAPDPPGSYHAVGALGRLRQSDYEGAADAALRIDAPEWHLGHLILAATAGLAGRAPIAMRARERLLELSPGIESELPSLFERWRVTPDLRDALLRGLRAAGLQLA